MVRINLQLFGGRGASSGGEGWLGGGGGATINPLDITSLVSARERKQTEVDETLQVFKDMNDEYGYVAEDLQLATLTGADNMALAYYDGSNVAFNQSYFNKAKMEAVYAETVKAGFHPSQGNKTALQAVASHEIGHALTDKVIAKMGSKFGKQDGAEAILKEAQKQVGNRGKLANMASKISGYAKESARECIAEAFADVYCNGGKAKKESQSIVGVMNKYLKS
jgi:hypothetical protein